MPKRKISFDTVRGLGLALPDTEEGTVWNTPALKVHGKMFACIPNHRSAEPNSLAVRISFEQRDALLAEEPETYHLPDHYVSSPCVLVRLSRVHADALRDLVQMAWRFVSSRHKRRPRKRTRG